MANPYFAFRQFIIRHDKCAMKVGTDGVLLGAWTRVENAARILDIGTGSGLIAIMLAQRSTAIIDAVEIDEQACIQARENFEACMWKDRITLYSGAVQDFENSGPQYDLIVSNPPFFRNSLRPPVSSRSVARHCDELSYEAMLIYASRLLSPDGRLSLILPAVERDHFTDLAFLYGLYPTRIQLVRPAPGKKHSRCLAEFGTRRYTPVVQDELTVLNEKGSGYSGDYLKLTGEYYL